MTANAAGHRTEAVAILAIAIAALIVHLGLAPPWPLIAVLAAATAAAIGVGLDLAAGVGVFFTAAAVCAEFVGLSPIPLVAGSIGYLAFDRLRPSPRRARWITRGRVGTRGAILVVAVAVVASSALLVWARFAPGDLARARSLFPADRVQLALAAIGFATINAAVEELGYRAILQTSLEQALARPIAALILQGALFGIAHYHGVPDGWAGVGLATIYGVMLGAMRLHLGGLLAVWIAHIFADLTIVVIIVTA